MADFNLPPLASFGSNLPQQDALQGPATGSMADRLKGLTPEPTSTTDIKKGVTGSIAASKRASLDELSLAKRIQHDPKTAADYAAASMNGNRLADDKVYREMSELSYPALVEKYGRDIADGTPNLLGDRLRVHHNLNSDRDLTETSGDLAVGAGVGLASALGGLGALALDEYSPLRIITNPIQETQAWLTGERPMDPSLAISELTSQAVDGIQSLRSDKLKSRAITRGTFDRLNEDDNKAEYSEAIANMDEGDYLDRVGAGITRWFNDQGDALGNLLDDPAMVAQTTAEGVGSLLPSAKLAKLATGLAAASESAILQKLAVPAAVGATEAGGAYSESAMRVMAMTEDELQAGSERYRELRAADVSHTEAQQTVALEAGRMTAAMVAPLAMLAGKFAEKFELSPMSPGSIKGAFGNIVKETAEEYAQSTVGAAAGNIAIQETADDMQDLLSGVGRAGATGAVGGFGMAGVLQGPLAGVVGAGKAVSVGARGVGVLANTILSKTDAAAEAGSSVSLTRTQDAAKGVASAAGQIQTLADGMVAQASDPSLTEALGNSENLVTPPESDETGDPSSTGAPEVVAAEVAQRVSSVAYISPKEINAASAVVRDIVNDGNDLPEDMSSVDRSSLLVQVAQEAQNTKYAPEQQREALVWIYDNLSKLESLVNEDLTVFGADGDTLKSSITGDLETLRNNRLLVSARKSVEGFEIADLPELSQETLATPAVQQVIAETAVVAQANPVGTNGVANSFILNQVDEGNITLPALVVQGIRVAEDLRLATEVGEKAKQALAQEAIAAGAVASNLRQNIDMVRDDIHGGDNKDAANQYSLNRYVSDITKAMVTGDVQKAKMRLDGLRNFVQHFQNKVEALGKSADLKRGQNNKIKFRGWTGKGWREATATNAYDAYTNPFSANGVYLAQAVAEDAKTLHGVYNTLVAAYGSQLEAEVFPPLVLHPIMSGVGKQTQEKAVNRDATENPQPQQEKLDQNQPVETAPTKDQTGAQGSAPADAGAKTEASDANQDPASVGQSAAVDGAAADALAGFDGGVRTGLDAGVDERAAAVPVVPVEAEPNTGPSTNYQRRIPKLTVGPVEQGLVVPSEPEVDPATAAAEDFSHLQKDPKSGRNLFVESVEVDATKGKLLGEESPLASMITALSHVRDFATQSGVGYYVDSVTGQTFQTLLQNHGAFLVGGMNRLLQYRTKTGGGKLTPTIGERIDQGADKLLHMDGRVFNLLDPRTGAFDARLIETAVIAAIHWAITATGSVSVTKEDIAKTQGISESQVSTKSLEYFGSGIQETRAAERLAQTILEFWGARLRTDVPMNEAQGIAQQLAAELLTLMDGRLVKAEQLDLPAQANGQPKQLNMILPQKLSSQKEAEAVRVLGPAKHLLRDVSVKLDEPEFYFDKVPTKVKMTQKRNFLGRISDKVAKALRRHQEVKFMRNAPLMDFLGAMEPEDLMAISGYQEIRETAMNESHQAMVRGKNNTIQHALSGVYRHEGMLQAYAKAEGKDPNKVATHFDWYQGRNGRIMAKGFTGQAIKWMRETFTPTVSVLDLSDAYNPSHHQFWITVAQSLGVKTERVYGADAVSEAQRRVDGPLRESIDHIRAWLEDPQANKIDKDVLIVALEAIGQPESVKALHALLAVARYEHVLELGTEQEQSAFEHMLSLEADGVTDGPVNAMMHFIAGKFDKDQIENMARGGVFLGSLGKTLNKFYEGGSRKDDIYQTASNALRRGMKTLSLEVQDKLHPKSVRETDTNALAVAKALYRVLGHYGQLEYDEAGKLVFGRGVMKNPLTITVYGSSLGGIMGKIAGAISDDLAEKMTALLELQLETGDNTLTLQALPKLKAYQQLYADLTLLTNRQVFKTREGYWTSSATLFSEKVSSFAEAEALYQTFGSQTQTALRDPLKFKFTPRNLEMLEANLLALMGAPMEAAVDSIMGETRETMKLIMGATQAQGHIFKELFRVAVQKRLKEKRNAGDLTKQQFLTQEDYDALFAEMSKYAAIVESYDQDPGESTHLNLSIAENVPGEEGGESFFRSVAGKFRLGATMPQPGNVGVSAASMLTISRGDAMMMVNYFADEATDLRVTQVYDGLEMPADMIEGISRRINEASFQAWLENPAQSVADSFDNFLRHGGAKEALAEIAHVETALAVARSLDIPGGLTGLPADIMSLKPDERMALFEANKAVISEELLEALRSRGEALTSAAQEIAARKEVYAQIGMTVDHMASGESPFVKEGLMPENPDDLVGFLEELREQALERLQDKRKAEVTQPVIQRASTRMRNLSRMYGEPLRDGKVNLIKPADLITLMRDADMPKEIRELFFAVAPKLGDFSIFVGSRQELNAYHNELLPPNASGKASDVGKGLTDVENRWLFLSNPSVETILHEAIHAAVAAMIYDHAADPSLVSESTRMAIENLTKLMDEFMGLDFSEGAKTKEDLKVIPNNERDALLLVQSVIRQALEKNPQGMGQAVALNEFMAWTLSNQHVGRVLAKTKYFSKLAKIVSQVAEAIRTLLGLKPHNRSMLSAIRFNAEVLFHAPENEIRGAKMSRSSAMEAAQEGISVRLGYIDLNQITDIVDEPTMQEKARAFHKQVETAVLGSSLTGATRTNVGNRAYISARRASTLFMGNHYGMTPNGKLLFEEMQATFATGMQLDSKSLVRAQQVYNHMVGQLTYEHFLDDPSTATQSDLNRAERQYRSLLGEYGYERHGVDKNNLLASFLALSQVSPVMRRALNKITLPPNQEFDTSSADAFLESVGHSIINTLTSLTAHTGLKSRATLQTLDTLVEGLGTLQAEASSKAELYVSSLIDAGNDKLVKGLSKLGDRAWDMADAMRNKPTPVGMRGTQKKVIQAAAFSLSTVLSESRGEVVAEKLLSMVNRTPRIPKVLSDLVAEVIGSTDANWGVLRLVNEVRAAVQAVRQDYREEVPAQLAARFSRKLAKHEWERLHKLGKADIGVLGSRYSVRAMTRLLKSQSYLRGEIAALQTSLQQSTGRKYATYMRKADELARFMMTGEVDSTNLTLARNAYALAQLLGEPGEDKMAGNNKKLVEDLDTLITLQALDLMDQNTKDTLSTLAQSEEDGMFFLLLNLGDTRRRENAKTVSDAAKLNAFKGYIPSERQNGTSLIVEDESKQVELIQRGYVRVGDYTGVEPGRKAYYYSAVSGRGIFQQGILQTVQHTYFGVSATTGYTASGHTAGVISGTALADLLVAMRTGKVRQGNQETLMPIYDENGDLVAYERTMDPAQISRLDQNTHVGEMLGAWAGRQAEEELASSYNKILVERLKEMWDKAKLDGDTAAYVDLSKRSNDPTINDARRLIPTEVMGMADAAFLGDGFMVRRDVLNNVVGYRLPSVTDMWTGNSNVPKELRDSFRKTATVLFGLVGQGNNSFKYLATTERFWQTILSEARNTIVVRSVVVPLANLASVFAQLVLHGITPSAIAKGMTEKLLEIEQYQKHQKLRVDLRGEMARYRTNPDKMRQLNAQMKRLDDADSRMSIWPLVKAGEFSTISEGMTQVDAALTSGKWMEWIQAQVDRVPGKLSTVGKYAMVARDTALFQGMHRATQYGDFLARAVLYDHLTKKKNQSKEEVLRSVNEEFVNYNFLPGRTRSYAESMGITWFWAFKIRSMKIALRHARNNPLRALMLGTLPVDVGLPMGDNLVSVALGSGLDHSMGLDMLGSAPELNPWWNLIH